MLFSVIIPSFRRADLLDLVLKDLSEQTYNQTDFEVIPVIDSPEEPYINEYKKVFEKYQNNTNFKFLINEKNIGAGMSRNKGIEAASGEYLVFIDDDMHLKPDFLQEYANLTNLHPNCVINGNIIDLGSQTPIQKYLKKSKTYFGFQGLEHGVESSFKSFFGGNSCIPRKVFEHTHFKKVNELIDGFESYGYEDLIMGYEISQLGYHFFFNAKSVVLHKENVQLYTFLNKKYLAGKTAFFVAKKFPELKEIVHFSEKIRFFPFKRFAGKGFIEFIEKFLNFFSEKLGLNFLFKYVIAFYFLAGMSFSYSQHKKLNK